MHRAVLHIAIAVCAAMLWSACDSPLTIDTPRNRVVDAVDTAFSVMLTFDASGSMSGAQNVAAKLAGHAFFRTMTDTADECGLLWFNAYPVLVEAITRDTARLHTAIDQLPSIGSTALWDGMAMGLDTLIRTGRNRISALVTLSDGDDLVSFHTPQEVLAVARAGGVRVFCVGLGSPVQNSDLSRIADSTGGEFYSTSDPSTLPSILVSISARLRAIARTGL